MACSKKCKKVTKFAFMLKRTSEQEVLRAFEEMLRKKSGKKNNASKSSYQVSSILGSGTHRPTIDTANNLAAAPNWAAGDRQSPLTAAKKRQGFASTRRNKSLAPNSCEE